MKKRRETSLPTPRQLKERAQETRERLKRLFTRPELKPLSGQCAVGLCRLEEKLRVALLLAEHMEHRKITSVSELAYRLFIYGDGLQTLLWMRAPVALGHVRSKKRHDAYLLALCGIEWNPNTRSFFCSENSTS